jgi:hypothetical protein
MFASFQIARTFETVEPLPNRSGGHFQLFRQVIDRQTLSTTQQIQDQLVDWPDGRMDCGIGNIHDSDPLKVWGFSVLSKRDLWLEYMGSSIFDKRYCEKRFF